MRYWGDQSHSHYKLGCYCQGSGYEKSSGHEQSMSSQPWLEI